VHQIETKSHEGCILVEDWPDRVRPGNDFLQYVADLQATLLYVRFRVASLRLASAY